MILLNDLMCSIKISIVKIPSNYFEVVWVLLASLGMNLITGIKEIEDIGSLAKLLIAVLWIILSVFFLFSAKSIKKMQEQAEKQTTPGVITERLLEKMACEDATYRDTANNAKYLVIMFIICFIVSGILLMSIINSTIQQKSMDDISSTPPINCNHQCCKLNKLSHVITI